ncbi:hypothetical protein AMAG_19675 [Allomyces macrogynus ATCC 38327]|uniref:Uncharacterized protein n=1 Tax=Allomyces macrogynus (strain ATCC 38327) TaxID=578462 RepID=A0A0L0SXH4_ALLM3|nr:hypothetical protein AMAG_19675 [Allomyces macrogynus ATCC 38327]|eukprot:KNE67263.1 hypothetical protein AMAG_19675 [Allomyces macrogynus ATCC 38327]
MILRNMSTRLPPHCRHLLLQGCSFPWENTALPPSLTTSRPLLRLCPACPTWNRSPFPISRARHRHSRRSSLPSRPRFKSCAWRTLSSMGSTWRRCCLKCAGRGSILRNWIYGMRR